MQSLENKKIVRVKQNDITEVDDIIAVEKK